jgi:hypothetical protein
MIDQIKHQITSYKINTEVDLTFLEEVMNYLSLIEDSKLSKIKWLRDKKVVPISSNEIKEWEFTGLNNRSFAAMHLFKNEN